MNSPVILICDDNPAIHESLTMYLRQDGNKVLSTYDGMSALEQIHLEIPDVIIIDLMLPDISGLEVCKEIRKLSNVPVIMISARSEEFDRIMGLDAGADDYVTKPFSPREVAARVRSMMRRNNTVTVERVYKFAELTVDQDAYDVYVNEKKIDLRPKEFEVLVYLITHAGKLLSREQILNTVWGYEYYGDARVVDTQVKRIRNKLIDDTVHFNIRSIYGAGYKLEETE